MVIRMPAGGGVRGGQSPFAEPRTHFVHTPGLKVIYPSTPTDTKGLLKSAIRDEDPVVFMEPKRLYRAVKEEVPDDEDFVLPIGPGQDSQRRRRRGAGLLRRQHGRDPEGAR